MHVFSRTLEQERIRQLMASEKPELVAIYGRRRVGKTFTVSQTLKENPDAVYFEFTGSLREDGRTQPLRDFLADFSLAWYSWMKTKRAVRSAEDCLMALADLSALGEAVAEITRCYGNQIQGVQRYMEMQPVGGGSIWVSK